MLDWKIMGSQLSTQVSNAETWYPSVSRGVFGAFLARLKNAIIVPIVSPFVMGLPGAERVPCELLHGPIGPYMAQLICHFF